MKNFFMIKLILVPTGQEINYYSSIKSNIFKPSMCIREMFLS